MKIATSELKAVLSRVEAVLPNKPNIMAIAGLLCELDGGDMTITATDLENTLRVECQVEGNKGKGSFLVRGREFIDLVKGLTVDSIDAEVKESTLTVSAEKSRYKFPLMDVNEFPVFPAVQKENTISVNGTEFADCLRAVAFCVDKDEPRPHFRGVLVEVLKKKIVFVGTDSRTLALKSIDHEGGTEIKILLPLKAVSVLCKVLDGDNADLYLSKKSLYVERDGISLLSQLLYGVEDFPDYNKVIPSKELVTAEIPIGEFRKSLDRLSIFHTERYIKTFFSFSNGLMMLSVSNPERGEASEEMAVKYNGKDMKLAFAPVFNAFLGKVNGDTLSMSIKDAKSPALLTGEDKNWQYVVMPLKMEE